jgi:probable selenium-dependent hydroxylase accessory protein YqeC
VLTPAERFIEAILDWFRPGLLYTFVGAGGKSTAMKRIAGILVEHGMSVRMTTTTHVGVEEFSEHAVRTVHGQESLLRAVQDSAPLLLMAGEKTQDRLRFTGVDRGLLEALPPSPNMVILVEGDGSRRLPMKAPRDHEPVIPSTSSAVFALLGACAFGEPVDAAHCYNHERALEILGAPECRFLGPEVAALAANGNGGRKGVLPGMGYRVLINQGDLTAPRPIAGDALEIMKSRYAIAGTLVSFQKGELYDAT